MQVWRAVEIIVKNYMSLIESNLLDKWHIVQARQRDAVKAYVISSTLPASYRLLKMKVVRALDANRDHILILMVRSPSWMTSASGSFWSPCSARTW